MSDRLTFVTEQVRLTVDDPRPLAGEIVTSPQGPAGPPGSSAPRQVNGSFNAPAGLTLPVTGAGIFGAAALTKFRAVVTAGSLTLTVSVNGVPVAGWTSVSVTTTTATFAPTSSPVSLADGDVLAIQAVSGSGTGLSFGFSE